MNETTNKQAHTPRRAQGAAMSSPKHTPATRLPWQQNHHKRRQVCDADGEFRGCGRIANAIAVQDAAYIAHACNAYPKLVEALRKMAERTDQLCGTVNTLSNAQGLGRKVWPNDFNDVAQDLLRELGEAE